MLTRAISVGLAVGLAWTAAACGSGSDDDPAGTQTEDRASNAEVAAARRCATEVTVLFWPAGHPAIPAIDFPYLPMPHFEIYAGAGPEYPTSAALAWAFAEPPGPSFPQRSTKPECLDSGESPEPEESQPVTDAVRLVCRLPQGVRIVNNEQAPNRYYFAVSSPATRPVVAGIIGADDSSLTYSSGSCDRTAPPRPAKG